MGVLLSRTTRYCDVKNACGGSRRGGGGGKWREHDTMITVIRTHNKVTRTLFTLAGEHNTDNGTITRPGETLKRIVLWRN